MSDERITQIKALTGFIDTDKFIKENPLPTLTKEELAALHAQTASLDALYQLGGLLSMTNTEMGRRDQAKRRLATIVISAAALTLSALSLAVSFFHRDHRPAETHAAAPIAPVAKKAAPARIPAKAARRKPTTATVKASPKAPLPPPEAPKHEPEKRTVD